MTNEELAVMIQNGRTEAILPLWEQVERFVAKQANKWEQAWTTRRVEFEDLYQSGFIAMMKAAQTYDPDNPVIKLAATQDYDAFAASELEIRQELGYPPYTEILKITVLDKEEVRGSSLAQRLIFCRRCSWNILNRNCWYWGRSLLLLPRYVTCTA